MNSVSDSAGYVSNMSARALQTILFGIDPSLQSFRALLPTYQGLKIEWSSRARSRLLAADTHGWCSC